MSFPQKRRVLAPTSREPARLQLVAVSRESAPVYGSYVDLLGASSYRNPCFPG
jgi:hypothetical protein